MKDRKVSDTVRLSMLAEACSSHVLGGDCGWELMDFGQFVAVTRKQLAEANRLRIVASVNQRGFGNVVFHVRINDGDTQLVRVVTTEHYLAAGAALSLLEYEMQEYNIVEIWNTDIEDSAHYYFKYDGISLIPVVKIS